MMKLPTRLLGVAALVFASCAMAQTPAAPLSGAAPAATTSPSADPYIQKREADAAAKSEYKAKKKHAKEEYKEEKAQAKSELKAEKRDSAQERKAGIAADKKARTGNDVVN